MSDAAIKERNRMSGSKRSFNHCRAEKIRSPQYQDALRRRARPSQRREEAKRRRNGRGQEGTSDKAPAIHGSASSLGCPTVYQGKHRRHRRASFIVINGFLKETNEIPDKLV